MSLPLCLWWCPTCNRGLGNDHRQCLVKDFHFDGAAWEAACIKNGILRARDHLIQLSAPSAAWLKKKNHRVILPPGEYYIGDVVTEMANSLDHKNIFGASICSAGAYTNGEKIAVIGNTTDNYALFHGSNRHAYLVESGMFGIMSKSLLPSESYTGTVHLLEAAEVRIQNGTFEIRSDAFDLKIETQILDTVE